MSKKLLRIFLKRVSLFGLKKKKVYPKMYLTGHSKGGNLAMYAYLKNPKLQGYIEGVKSFDGPGFAEIFGKVMRMYLRLQTIFLRIVLWVVF